MKDFWNQRYSESDYAYGIDPNEDPYHWVLAEVIRLQAMKV